MRLDKWMFPIIALLLSSVRPIVAFRTAIPSNLHLVSSTHSNVGSEASKMSFVRQERPKLQSLRLLPIPTLVQEAVAVNTFLATVLTLMKQNSLTPAGLAHSTALGIGLWSFLGISGWSVCALYFVLGSLATKVKMAEKEKLGIAEKREGRRGPENVWGSAATAILCAMASYAMPELSDVFKVGFVAAIATKLSDTLGSELGKAYGKTAYLITTLKLVPRGTEGAVSVEGTLFGVVGSIAIALFGQFAGLLDTTGVVITIASAFMATTVESYIGATFQDDSTAWLTNELVNLIMTVIGAVIAMTIYSIV